MKMIKKYSQFFFFFPFSIFIFFLTRTSQLPYVGYNAWNFNAYFLIAKNLSTFGLLSSKLAPIISVSQHIPDHPLLYIHHPTLLYILMALVFNCFGPNFFTGRLVVLLASIFSLLFIYLIAKKVGDKKYALIVSLVFVYIPASSIFGRMIGHEAFVLFFTLITVFLLLLYFEHKEKIYLVLSIVTIILGTLSDWPMTYFTVSLLPYLFYKKKLKLGLLFVSVSVISGIGYLLYIYFLTGSLSDLITAFFTRSTGALLTKSYWEFRWFATIFVRLLLYFNPIFIFLSTYFFLNIKKILHKKGGKDIFFLSLSFLLFGVIHIILYPEGSFGHPYWTYYLLPGITFTTGYIIYQLSENRQLLLALFGLFLFSFVFLIKIEGWKTKEIKANIFRYSIMKKADSYLSPFEKVLINRDGVVDSDLIEAQFAHEVTTVPYRDLFHKTKKTTHFLYSCLRICNKNDLYLSSLLSQFDYIKIYNDDAEMYVFNIKKKNKSALNHYRSIPAQDQSNKPYQVVSSRRDGIRYVYEQLLQVLQVPQL